MNRIIAAAFGSLLIITALTGCKPFQHPWAMSQTPPPDFSLEVSVDAPWQGADDPLTTPSQYVVLPDRKLHAAIGPGATNLYFPQPTATLSHNQYAMLWSIIDTHGLMKFEGLDALETAVEEQAIDAIDTPQQQQLQAMPGQVLQATPGIEEIREQDAERDMINESEQLDESVESGSPITQIIEPGRSGRDESPQPQILPVVEPQTMVEEPPLPTGIYEVTDDGLIPVEKTPQPRMNLAFQIEVSDEVPTTQATDEDAQLTVYRVTIRAYGDHHEYTTSPEASAGTSQLVQTLAGYRGWTPVLRSGLDGETIETEVDAPVNP